jgi:cell filamentation protein
MTKYWAGNDPYCWPSSPCLKNRLQLTDPVKLQIVEGDLVRARADIGLPNGRFSVTHYCACHRWLFGDIYAWAGQYRTVRLAKSKSVFCYPEHIGSQMRTLFSDLKQGGFLAQTDRATFVARTAWFWSELNAIHPFREGNGRTQTLFLANLALAGGWYLDLTRLKPTPTLAAMADSFQSGSGQPLLSLVESLIKP